MEALEKLLARAKELWNGASPLIRALVSIGALMVLGGLVYALTVEPDHDLTPLTQQPMSLQQAGQIASELEIAIFRTRSSTTGLRSLSRENDVAISSRLWRPPE